MTAVFSINSYAFLLMVGGAFCQDVPFPSGHSLTAVSPSSLGSGAADVADPKATGSYLFDSTGILKKHLTLTILVRDFKSSSSNYFRAHPVFVDCLQNVLDHLNSLGITASLVTGFKTKTDVAGSNTVQDLYARSGVGAVLHVAGGVSSAPLDIAGAALLKCPVLFAQHQRDIGIVLQSSSVHIHMTGDGDTEPYFSVDGYSQMTTAAFRTWALNKIDEGLDPMSVPNCSLTPGIDRGTTFPSGVSSPSEIVGSMDLKVTQNTPEDLRRLVQYLGRNIEFENSERSASWCGKAGIPCVDCRSTYLGNSLSKRCSDRLMTSRMYNVISILQKMVRNTFPTNKLKILEAYDEAYAGHPNGDSSSPNSHHFEGRAVVLKLLSNNTAANLKVLSQLAICAGADYVEHKENHLLLASKKMKGTEAELITFGETDLLVVQPPQQRNDTYQLPAGFSEHKYPLFDADNQESEVLTENATIGKFKSQNGRYFRLDPDLVECYSQMVYQLNKHKSLNDIQEDLIVKRSFLTTTEQNSLFDPSTDKRGNFFILGQAFEISTTSAAESRKVAQLAVDRCPLLLYQADRSIGVGLYPNSVFINLQDLFEVWVADRSLVPQGTSVADYIAKMGEREQLAIKNRIVDPDNLVLACTSADPPHRQSTLFKYVPSPSVRTVSRQSDADACVPKRNTPFCKSTKVHRDKHIELMWKEISRKYFYRDRDDVENALKGCFGDCGTCTSGSVFEDKKKNCDNFIHWVSFEMLNDREENKSNFYSTDNLKLRRHACFHGGHCMDKSPLFALIIESSTALYRPDPTKSVEEELYSAADNPLPVDELLMKMYAIHAVGTVNFWVQDDVEMSAMRESLKVIMLYNKKVTDVNIYLEDSTVKTEVINIMENLMYTWATTGCSKFTREYLPPYQILDIPKNIVKRSAEPDFGEELLAKRLNWEIDWIEKMSF